MPACLLVPACLRALASAALSALTTHTRAAAPCSPQTLQFQTVQHKITTSDSQPTPGGGILTLVTGDLAVDGNVTTPLKFAQSFHLMPNGASWYIHNDLFRLNYG